MRKLLLICAFALFGLAVPSAASAATVWNLDIHHAPTNFAPGAGTSAAVNPSPSAPGCDPVEGSASADEVQCLVIKALGGKFKLTFSAQTTPDLDFDSTAAELEAALEALPTIGAGNVAVSGGPGNLTGTAPYRIAFTGSLSNTDVSQLLAASSTSGDRGSDRLGGAPQYWFDVSNVGDTASTGTTTIVVNLPSGVSRALYWNTELATGPGNWSCPGSPGDTSLICTTSGSILGRQTDAHLVVAVNVAAGIAPGTERFATAQVSGGGAAAPSPTVFERTAFSPSAAPFGILPDSFAPGFFAPDGLTALTGAGTHPPLFTVPFDLTAVDQPAPSQRSVDAKRATESIRHLTAELPPGFLGDPTALPECALADFLAVGVGCPPATQVGKIQTSLAPTFQPGFQHIFTRLDFAVYNLVPPKGAAADLGFILFNNPIHIRAGLDATRNYAINSVLIDVNETFPPFNQRLTLWGVPADPSHDNERCLSPVGELILTQSCPAGVPRKPFLTTPFECGAVKSMRLRDYDSWDDSGDFGSPLAKNLAGAATGDCDQVPFAPTVSVAPTTDVADSPSGLDVQIDLPQSDDPDAIATSPLKDATVTLPEGLTVNPAAANGLDACAPAQIALGTDQAPACPDASRIADVQVITPVLPDPVGGTVYLAAPHNNPFDTLLAAYIVLSEPQRGILIKIPGRVDVDAATGQLTGVFKDNPQLPFSEFELNFKAGAHAALIAPKTCGDYESTSQLSGWAANPPTQGADAFTIAKSPSGGACPGEEAALPNSPSFDAGTVSPISHNYSPFVLRLRREDGSQRFSALGVTLPQGLTGKLAGTALCPDGALAGAAAKSGEDERANPSCPLESRVGVVHAAAGAGPDPYNAQGTAYLAGPYKGAPLSMAVITPATAGPFDLGTIVIRTPLHIDPRTAQISAITDPIPQILQGIPLNVRSVNVVLDRPEFTLTGTSCDPLSIDGLLTSTLNQTAPLSARYQLSDCGRLPFKPKTILRLRGGTKRGQHPALRIAIVPRAGDANISFLQIAFPRSEFLENAHIRTICTRPAFAADACPAGAVYGRASVQTPLLDYPLIGNVYLRSSDNLLPDVVPDFRGPAHQPIKLESAGRTDSIRGGIRNTIDFVPDAPFSRAVVQMQGGNKGLLVNSRDICARVYRATVRYRAHNGRAYVERPKLRARCKRARRGKRGKRGGHRREAKGSAVASRQRAVR